MINDYPPRVPQAMRELDRAIVLLGEAAKQRLSHKTAEELRRLIGATPDRDTAAAWKKHVKALRADLVAEDQTKKAG